ncbi:MAG TPA: DNA recombination protein RmuC [Bryobacteraceae bacterium]|jgi:DNA recombination protein RmuC|nr:DNA recombination protein RmuC [Bryobacteraceae bacterium]
MTVLLLFLLFSLMAAVAFAAYQFADAKRWRRTASERAQQSETHRAEAEEARQAAIRQEVETAKVREVADLQLKLLTQSQSQLEERFRVLAADALQSNSQLFLDRSREHFAHLVEPVSQSLRRFEDQVQSLEQSRIGAYEGITAQVQALTDLQERVRQSTEQLKTALRSPIQRGRWGEMQLRRVVELSGMLEHCDFAEQETLFGERRQRPDLIVQLPNGCQVVVDSKVSLEAYLRAVECEDEAARAAYLADHARQIRTHVKALAEKAYWQQLPGSPEFVVAFLPLESLFSAALEHDPDLLAFAARSRVVIASPITLITLLLTVAHGWHQQRVAEDLKSVAETGAQLYDRLLTMSENFTKLGEVLEKTVATYNTTANALERRVFASARRLKNIHSATAAEIETVREIELTPRTRSANPSPADQRLPID